MDMIHKDRDDCIHSNLNEYKNYKLMMELSDGIFHDFKNILGNISGLTQLSLIETETNELKSNLNSIYEATSEFKEALNRYQDLIKGEKVKVKEPIKLNAIINKSIEMVRFRFYDNKLGNIRLVTDIRTNSMVLSNCYDLNQTFINIIMNAIESMEESGGTLTVSVYNIEDHVCIRFNDTGIGIDEDKLKILFKKPFTTKANGSGLGLKIAKAAIEDHGGNINIKSKVNQGTEVNISLPIYKEEDN